VVGAAKSVNCEPLASIDYWREPEVLVDSDDCADAGAGIDYVAAVAVGGVVMVP
jgi:hypothetical protein